MTPPFLPHIHSPDDLRKLSPDQLPELAREMRYRLLEVISKTGGHLASGLGSVELTIALHWVFDSPTDRFIFDVGHQTYPHKILTGRNALLPTIRQWEGLAPFQDPNESNHDPFHSGHAGTALSLGLGMCKNRDLAGREEYIIPIIGDATLTCGLAYEALNNVSRHLSRFIVILNDNEMSISRNVGAITRILSRLVSNPTLQRIHADVDGLLEKIPSVGPALAKQGHRLLESVKNLFSSKAFFEQYGLAYIGPYDGHDVHKLIDVLTRVKETQGPVIIHTLTTKGKGMEEATRNPITWHGAKPFCLSTGKFHPSPAQAPTFPKVFGSTLLEMGREDSSVTVITPAMSCGSSLDPFMEAFPERCFDVGIAESHSLTFAGGLGFSKGLSSSSKRKVFASIYSTFLQRAMDNLYHDICLQGVPVVVAIDRAGIAGGDGASHNGIYDLGFLSAMPNLVIAQPRDGQVLKELLTRAHGWEKPVAIRYPNLPTSPADKPLAPRLLGRGERLAMGKDVLIIALGHMNQTAGEVRELAAACGIEIALFDPIFLKPLDREQLDALLTEHTSIVTLEEHSLRTGLGSLVNSFIIQEGYPHIDVLNLGVPDVFVPHGKYTDILESLDLTPRRVWGRIAEHFGFSTKHNPISTSVS